MKKAEDFRREMGPVDPGFHTVFCKTLEELQAEGQKNPGKKPIAVYPARVRIIAAAAALVLLAGAGILGITRRNGGLEPADKIQDEHIYTILPIEAVLAPGGGQDTEGAGTGEEEIQARNEGFDPERDVIQFPGVTMNYVCMLQDGRLLLTGAQRTETEDLEYIWKEQLLCLNPDGTVSWEYTGPEEKLDGNLWNDEAAVLKDGTIALKHALYPRGEPEQISVQFFTPDGNRLDRQMGPFEGNIGRLELYSSCLLVEKRDDKGESTGTEVLDWNGNLITRYMEAQVFGEGMSAWMQEEEPVLYGYIGTDKTRAKIVKMDGRTDRVLWENTLDYQWPDTDNYAGLENVVKTGDGGYAALLWEYRRGATEDDDTTRYAVVKFDADGGIRWIQKTNLQSNDLDCSLYMQDGKIALICSTVGEAEAPWTVQWFDEEGNSLGTAEMEIKPEYFAVLSGMTAPKSDKVPRILAVDHYRLVSRQDGLWAIVSAYLGDYYRSENELGPVLGSDDMIMIRLPEPPADPADTGKEDILAREEEIYRAREAIAGAYPELDLLNSAEYGFEGEVHEWGTEVHFRTRNISHGDVRAAALPDGTIRLDEADREKAGDVNTLFRRYQSAYGRINLWKQETWVQLGKDLESMEVRDTDPDPIEGTLLKMTRFPEENTVSISRDEALERMWETAHGEDDFCVLIDSDPHPVWKFLSNTWPVERLLEIDAETGEVVANELCDTRFTPAYALFSTEKNRRALELKELGTKEIARREVRYAFAEMNEELEEPLPMPDFDNPEEYDVLVNGRVVRFAGRWNDLKTFELELDENGYVARCDITDTISGRDRTK